MYQLIEGGVKNLDTGGCIVEGGNGWEEYLLWLDEGNTPLPMYTDEQLLQMAKDEKIIEINSAFYTESTEPVDVAGVLIPAGKEAIIELNQEKEFAVLLGLSSVVVFDVYLDQYALDFSQMDNLILRLVETYRPLLQKKYQLLKAVRDAVTVEEVNLIGW